MRRQWLRWLLIAGTATAVGCGGGDNPDVQGNDASDIQTPTDQQTPGDVQDVQTPTDVQDVQMVGMDVQDVQTPMDVQDVQTPTDVQDVVTPTDVPGDTAVMPTVRTQPTNGSAVAISPDGTIAVAANRTTGTVSVFTLNTGASPPTATRVGAPLSTGANSEPWAVVFNSTGTYAYVILRRDQQVIRIDGVRTATPSINATHATTGSEPTGLAISPTGAQLYVANWAEGTVSVVNTADMSIARTVDLNASLASSGMLGTVAARAALAHPRAIAVTNNGDTNDADETVYVTEFFSQARSTSVPTDDSAFDQNRQGVVYRFNAGTGTAAAPITLSPFSDTGFQDSTPANTGCIPNQLYAATINNGRLYVTSVCESPRGPTGLVGTSVANFKTEIHSAVYVVDTSSNAEISGSNFLMTRAFQALYDAASTADDATRRMPLIPNDIAFAPSSNIAYVSSYGSDAVFRIAFNTTTPSMTTVGSSTAQFISLQPAGMAAGRLPIGISIAPSGSTALVLNENSRNLSLVTFSTQAVTGVVESHPPAAAGPEAVANDGRRFFVTGLGRWSLRGQGWNSCEGCHPDGLTDNITWFFARGPRQTTSLDGTYGPDGHRRLLNWTAIFDEVHDFELNTRGNSGGVGAIVHTNSMPPTNADRIVFDGSATGTTATLTRQDGLNGSTQSLMATPPTGITATTPQSVLNDWNAVDSYVRTIRAPRAPTNLNATDVAAGRTLFQAAQGNCVSCHGGNNWTISRVFWTPGETHNNPLTGDLFTTNYTAPSSTSYPLGLNPASNNAMRRASLRYNGMVQSMPATLTLLDAANDQINCALRAVGTFPGTLDSMMTGVVPSGSNVRVREVRANMTTTAQGATGFNIPSLLGMATGAPYFHAGNARTLEEVLDTTFASHYHALSANFLDTGDRALQVRQLVAFLLSIDDSTTMEAVPTTPFNPDLCPTMLTP